MKKILLVLVLSSTVFINCKLHQDQTTFRYYTTPKTNNINQNEYHEFVWGCKDLAETCLRTRDEEVNLIRKELNLHAGQHGSYTENLRKRLDYLAKNENILKDFITPSVTRLLQRVATPTSIRLLNDLIEVNFKILI